MEDLEQVASLYQESVSEMCYSHREKGFAQIMEEGVSIVVDFFADHTGGLEGFYSTDYEGSLYINNECYCFRMIDTFCDEGSFEIYEKLSEEDLQPDDRGYVDLSSVEVDEDVKPKEKLIMSNERQLVTIILMDEDKDLDSAQALVGKFEDIIVEGTMNDTEVIIDFLAENVEEVQEAMEEHNEKRSEINSKAALARHGKEVKLLPVKFRDLKVIIKQ